MIIEMRKKTKFIVIKKIDSINIILSIIKLIRITMMKNQIKLQITTTIIIKIVFVESTNKNKKVTRLL
jgi:hypothetical protein